MSMSMDTLQRRRDAALAAFFGSRDQERGAGLPRCPSRSRRVDTPIGGTGRACARLWGRWRGAQSHKGFIAVGRDAGHSAHLSWSKELPRPHVGRLLALRIVLAIEDDAIVLIDACMQAAQSLGDSDLAALER